MNKTSVLPGVNQDIKSACQAGKAAATSFRGVDLQNDHANVWMRDREEGDEVCPVTVAEELLAMQIHSQGGGKNLEWEKNFKETFPPTFLTCIAIQTPNFGWKLTALKLCGLYSPQSSPHALMSRFIQGSVFEVDEEWDGD